MAFSRVYRLAPLAEIDIEDIWSYTASQWSDARADQYIRDLLIAFAELANGMRIGTARTVRLDYRQLLVGSHAIFYRESSSRIDVIRILHQSMDVKRHLT